MTPLFNNDGFTLIELLVVVLIIGVLAAVAVPQYQKAVDKARMVSVLPIMRSVVKAENVYNLEHGNYTAAWTELDLDIPHTWMGGKYLNVNEGQYQLDLTGGVFPYILFTPSGSWVMLLAFFPQDEWLCYPQNNARGKALCKSLGCTNVEGSSCTFKP